VPLAGELLADIRGRYPALDRSRTTHELMRRVITRLVEDVIAIGRGHLVSGAFLSAQDVRQAGRTLVAFSPRIAAAERGIKGFLYPNMYRHPRVMKIRHDAAEVVVQLFQRLFGNIALLPQEWQEGLAAAGEDKRARRVADYIAGMTDTFALGEHRRLFDTTPDLR